MFGLAIVRAVEPIETNKPQRRNLKIRREIGEKFPSDRLTSWNGYLIAQKTRALPKYRVLLDGA